MAEIEEFDEQMQDLLQGIEMVIEREIPRMKGQERIEKCSYLRNRLARAKQVHRSILVEMRDLADEKKPDWEARAKQYEARIGKLLQDVDWAETTAKGDAQKKAPEEMTAKEMTQAAIQVQEQTLESTARAKHLIAETVEVKNLACLDLVMPGIADILFKIGTAVNDELRKQGEQIHAIAEGIEQVETNMKRAEKQLRVFMRRRGMALF
ncbi:hypothetical protein HDU96_005327 [Phlyctochytrium bullatum]|nr:hypothetical protein HDU96_005327 [Phlyctochytrium bullatum]